MRCARILALSVVFATILVSWLMPGDAHAHARGEPSFAPECHAVSSLEVTFEEMVDRGRWTCSDRNWRADQPVAWVRFSDESWAGEERPRYFFTRYARFAAITFAALDADGTLRTARFTEGDGKPFGSGPVFQLELPEVKAETRAILMRVERPHSVPLLSEARLAYYPEDADWSQVDMMLLALVIGMLVLPLFFDISFFVVLRERFIALHAVMVVSMMTYVLFAGGLISVFVELPVRALSVAGPLFWAIGCGMSAVFLADFLEEHAQSRFMRRLTLATGIWTIFVPGFFALQFHWTQPIDDRAYFITFIPTILVITAALIEAIWRGSTSARFIAIAWTPIILASIERMLRGFGLYAGPSTLDQMLYVATGIEVTMISLAIGERFLALRRERDAALTEARMLEQLSERDPLTGLMNRRAVEARFGDLRAQGFDTFALIDLDRFKDINDRFGHQIGDRALIACAGAMVGTEERDSIAVRLGGEEFLVLLRGNLPVERAEKLRKAIPMRIANEVPGLDRPVTASMGVIELPRSSSDLMSFDAIYARADKLMYEAKASGRNRMMYERLTIFSSQTPPRRNSDCEVCNSAEIEAA